MEKIIKENIQVFEDEELMYDIDELLQFINEDRYNYSVKKYNLDVHGTNLPIRVTFYKENAVPPCRRGVFLPNKMCINLYVYADTNVTDLRTTLCHELTHYIDYQNEHINSLNDFGNIAKMENPVIRRLYNNLWVQTERNAYQTDVLKDMTFITNYFKILRGNIKKAKDISEDDPSWISLQKFLINKGSKQIKDTTTPSGVKSYFIRTSEKRLNDVIEHFLRNYGKYNDVNEVKFICNNKTIDESTFKELLKVSLKENTNIISELKDKVSTDTLKFLMLEQFVNQKIQLNERYVGDLYHFTDLYSAYDIIKDNQINKGYYPDDIIDSRVANFVSPEEGVCLTRQKNFKSFECNICVRFTLDGEKMGSSLRNSKMYPLSYQGDGKNGEAEERLYNVPITPLDKYCKGIQILVYDLNKDASDRYNFLTFLDYNEKIIDEVKENLNIDLNYTLPTEEIVAKVNQYIIDTIKSNDVFGNMVNVKYKHQPTILENAEQELTAYHGSGADFDRFDHSFMGTGEGAQAFGWGTYVTTDRGTAKCYAKVASDGGNGTTYFCNGKKIDREVFIPLQVVVSKLQTTNPTEISKELMSIITTNQRNLQIKMGKLSLLDQDKMEQRIQNAQKALEYIKNNGNTPIENVKSVKSGQIIYEVDIPDDNGENYIPWENTPKNIILNILNNLTYLKVPNTATQNFDFWFEEIYEFNTKQNQVVSPKQLSMDLSKLGYVGIKVPTGYLSGGNGKGFNYVIFKEENVEIVEKYDLLESADNESLVDKDEYMIGSEGAVGNRNMNFSHVITEGYQGETITVFHGSGRDFNQFSISDKELKLGNVFGKGIYTTTNINNAKSYVSDNNLNACDGYVYELAIPIDNEKNYLDNSKMIPKMVLFRLLTRFSKYAIKKGAFKMLWKEFFDISEIRFQQFMNAICYSFNQNSQMISHALREMGYYGVKVPQANQTWYIVFYPEDVKIVKKHIVKYNNTTFKRDLFMTENVETEIQAFHGSRHNFDKFNHKKYLSSGAGSQSFGWGNGKGFNYVIFNEKNVKITNHTKY